MLNKLLSNRRKKLDNIKKAGINPYPAKSKRSLKIAETIDKFNELEKLKKRLSLVGRIMSFRDQGKLVFFDINDGTGKIQAFASSAKLKNFVFWKENLDIGDFIQASGTLFKTKRGEKSLNTSSITLLAKSLRPLPAKWYGLKDIEERFRKRYLDMIFNIDVLNSAKKRSELIRHIREFLWKKDFLEVETPILQQLPGGAVARPFVTRHNTLKQDFYLRVAPELFLKRLLVAGFDKVFEMGRDFRNEGIDRDHNPEFTMLELYWAYQDYIGLMKFVRKMLKPYIPGAWGTMTFSDACIKYGGKDYKSIRADKLDDFFKKEVRPKLKKPIFITDYPSSIIPLAKYKADEPELTESFQLIVGGMEIVKGFSEMNDPIAQREQMEAQEKLYRQGNREANRLDEEFLEALEYGMPPAAGLGIGIDRLAMIYTKRTSIKEIILFPTLRYKK